MRIVLGLGVPLLMIMASLSALTPFWDAKNECDGAVQASMNMSWRDLEKDSGKTIVDGCKRADVLGRGVERAMTGSSY